MARKNSIVYICGDGDPTVQCGYCSYGGAEEAWRKKIPTHIHQDADGYRYTVYGPADKCLRAATEAQDGSVR